MLYLSSRPTNAFAIRLDQSMVFTLHPALLSKGFWETSFLQPLPPATPSQRSRGDWQRPQVSLPLPPPSTMALAPPASVLLVTVLFWCCFNSFMAVEFTPRKMCSFAGYDSGSCSKFIVVQPSLRSNFRIFASPPEEICYALVISSCPHPQPQASTNLLSV